MDENWTQSEIFLHNILQLISHQTDVMEAILEELTAIRQATEQANEPGPDDEPSLLQSLSG